MLPSWWTAEILKRWRTAIAGVPAPSEHRLSELLDTALFASMETEEGQSARFSIGIAPCGSVLSHQLAEPLALARKPLVKLSAGCHWDASLLMVDIFRDPAVIWAVARNDPPRPRQSPSYGLPRFVTLTVRGPGVLSLRWGHSVYFQYTRGEGSVGPEFNVTPLIEEALASEPRTSIKIDHLSTIHRVMNAHGRGGCLLLVDRLDDQISFTYRVEPSDVLARLIRNESEARQRSTASQAELDPQGELFQQRNQAIGLVEEELESIGRLTAVDGATVLKRNLELVGFGGKIRDTRPPTTVDIANPDGSRAAVDMTELRLGMRHTSAVAICNQLGCGTLALVKSEDGDLTVAVHDGRRVVVARPVARLVPLFER